MTPTATLTAPAAPAPIESRTVCQKDGCQRRHATYRVRLHDIDVLAARGRSYDAVLRLDGVIVQVHDDHLHGQAHRDMVGMLSDLTGSMGAASIDALGYLLVHGREVGRVERMELAALS